MSVIRIVCVYILVGLMFAFQPTMEDEVRTPMDQDNRHKEPPKIFVPAAARGSAHAHSAATHPSASTNIDVPQEQQLRVEVYYEVLCPDSRQFIRNQLNLVMMDNHLLPYTDLVFVPYGKVSSWKNPLIKNTTLFCQHGIEECELNALHACLVENNLVEDQMRMINCLMGSTNDVEECASLLNIDINAAQRCKLHRSTPDILRLYGEKTNAIDITIVPTVIIDGVLDRTEQRHILFNLMNAFCTKYTAKFGVVLENCQL